MPKLTTSLAKWSQIVYIATERPMVVYFNKKFINNVSVASRRRNRDDPVYYINFYIDILMPLGNNVSVDVFFYELQNGRYHRTFVEIHSKLCDFIEAGTLFGESLKKAIKNHPCPFQPGQLNLSNLTIPLQNIPKNFPYKQGRLYCNTTIVRNGVFTKLSESYIDIEVRSGISHVIRGEPIAIHNSRLRATTEKFSNHRIMPSNIFPGPGIEPETHCRICDHSTNEAVNM
ncbi:hypothetical protein SFRURICE_005992 [Spodoptera frugiperda]|nr:hypothetical protein SFRURICE_005992 [Spodoptera frugiperda]